MSMVNLLSDNNFQMDTLKPEFKRLIEIMGWSQTEAAAKLGKTPSAINHLLNPDHPNKPTKTTLRLLKLLISRERPDLFNTRTFELKAVGRNAETAHLTAKERVLVERLRELPRDEQEKIYAVIDTMLDSATKAAPHKNKK
jgi:transcriptional regulator with XRE-family HTH domain